MLHPPYSSPGHYTHLVTSVTHFQPATAYAHRTHHPVVTLIWLHPVTHFPLHTFQRPNATSNILITRSLHSFGYIRHMLSTGHTHDTYSISHTLTSLRPSNTPRRFTHFGHVRYTRQATLVQLTQSLHTDSPGYIRYTRQPTLVQLTQSLHTDSPGYIRYTRQPTLVQLTQLLHTDSPGYIRYTRQPTLVQLTQSLHTDLPGYIRYTRQPTLVQLTQSLHADSPGYIRYTRQATLVQKHTDSPGYIRYIRQATLVQNTLIHLVSTSVTFARPRWSNSLCSYTLTHLATSVTLAQRGTLDLFLIILPCDKQKQVCDHKFITIL